MRPAGLPPVGEYCGVASCASPTMRQPSSSKSKPLDTTSVVDADVVQDARSTMIHLDMAAAPSTRAPSPRPRLQTSAVAPRATRGLRSRRYLTMTTFVEPVAMSCDVPKLFAVSVHVPGRMWRSTK